MRVLEVESPITWFPYLSTFHLSSQPGEECASNTLRREDYRKVRIADADGPEDLSLHTGWGTVDSGLRSAREVLD